MPSYPETSLMIAMKLFHIVLGIFFPLLASNCFYKTASTNCTHLPSLPAFINFCFLMLVCGVLHINKSLTSRWKGSILSTIYWLTSNTILWCFLGFCFLHCCSHIHSKYNFFLFLIGFLIVIAFGLIFRIRLGFSEALFNLVVVPLVVMLSYLITLGEFSVDVAVKFSPLNLLFLVYSITETSTYKSPKSTELQQSSKPGRITIFQLLG